MGTLTRRRLVLASALTIPTRGLVARWKLGSNNLLQQSGNVAEPPWSSDNSLSAVTTANAAVGPGGSMTAAKFHNDTIVGLKDLYQFATMQNGATYTFSFALKAAEYSCVDALDQGDLSFDVTFDASSGVVAGASGPGYVSSSIVALTNGWYRCTVTFINQQTTGSRLVAWYLNSSASTHSTATDGTSGVYLDEVQLNAGSTPLPYVATTNLQTIPDLSNHGNTLQLGSTAGVDANDPTVQTTALSFDGVDDEVTGLPALGSIYTVLNDDGTHVYGLDSDGRSYVDGLAQAGATNFAIGSVGGYTGLAAYRAQYSVILMPSEHLQAARWIASQRVIVS